MYSFLGPQVQEWVLFEEIIAERLHRERGWACCKQTKTGAFTDELAVSPSMLPAGDESVDIGAVRNQLSDTSLATAAADPDTDDLVQSLREEQARLREEKKHLYRELKKVILQEQRAAASQTRS
ncbi:hypothetical protein CCYA_CCYA10G2799 [Cyanidiococcus yangmingshanensis]|nr:hypothetical protein CCYA_CCYA10G2799 [Cyanidiococcus yangmingshanensis]